jgi:ABC-type multidrug transport system ATPase subunit
MMGTTPDETSDETPDMRQELILRAHDLSFAYTSRLVFSHWSHDFGAGLTWVRGHNGDGKSTLLKLLAGALAPRSGTISIHDFAADRHPIEYRRKVFWCGPGPIPFDHLSPAEYFGFMRNLYPTFDATAASRHVEWFHLTPHMNSPLNTLSTGTQRKVWLSAALAAETPIILLDEPINALDADSVKYLLSVLNELAHDSSRIGVIASHEHLGAAANDAAILDLSAQSNRLELVG